MKETMFLLFILVAPVLCEDAINLVATEERQRLNSPSLEGIPRPHVFKWRLWFNNSATDSDMYLVVNLHYLDVPERSNCSGSYIELIRNGHISLGQRCADLREETFDVFGSYLDVIYHIGTENGTHGFKMSYFLKSLELSTSSDSSDYKEIIGYVLCFIVPILVVCFYITACHCASKHRRKGQEIISQSACNNSQFEKIPDSVDTWSTEYDDVI